MPDIALQYTQSLSQLGVGLAIALLYFIEYQVRICERLASALDRLRPKLDELVAFDSLRFEQARETPVEIMNKDRRNQSFKQHEEVELLEVAIKLVNRRMWYHVHNLRQSSDKLLILCLIIGTMSFLILLFSTIFPDKKVSSSVVLAVALLSVAALLYLVNAIVSEARKVERTYRRRFIREGERLEESHTPDPKGLDTITVGDEVGVVYYLERQMDYRIKQIDKYAFSRYENRVKS